LLLFVSAYLAWRDEYLTNMAGPEVLLSWESREYGHDLVTLRNLGPGIAINIEVGDFSWSNVTWIRQIEALALESGEIQTFEADFHRQIGPHKWRSRLPASCLSDARSR